MLTTDVAEISGWTFPSRSYHNFLNFSRRREVGRGASSKPLTPKLLPLLTSAFGMTTVRPPKGRFPRVGKEVAISSLWRSFQSDKCLVGAARSAAPRLLCIQMRRPCDELPG